MSWSFYLLLIPTICYAAAAAIYAKNGNLPLCIVYFGYALANCGLLALDAQMAKG